jgi:uroporphyrinogen-III decarboxylase
MVYVTPGAPTLVQDLIGTPKTKKNLQSKEKLTKLQKEQLKEKEIANTLSATKLVRESMNGGVKIKP